MHESAVNVSVEQVRHGQYGAVPERRQVGAGPLTARVHILLLGFLRAVVQQIHEQREIPATAIIRLIE